MVKYRDLSTVDLKRNSTVQYSKTRPTGNPLPASCPTLAQLTPVFNSWAVDFSLLPDGPNLGPGFTPYNTICLSRSNTPITIIAGGLAQSGSDPVFNLSCNPADPTNTAADPSMSYYTAIPFNVKDQIVQAEYRGTVYNVDGTGLATNTADFSVMGRINQVGVGTRYDLNLKAYLGTYTENWDNMGNFLNAGVTIAYWNAGVSALAGAVVPKMNAGEVLTLTMANFRFSPTIEAVCLKVYTAGVQRAAFTDATANRILTGSMGLGTGSESFPNNVWLQFNNFLAEQVGPNPT